MNDNAPSLPNKASDVSFPGNFFDRGAFEESTENSQKASAYHISGVVVDLTGLEVHGATIDGNPPSLPTRQVRAQFPEVSSIGAFEESTAKVQQSKHVPIPDTSSSEMQSREIRSSSSHLPEVSSIGGVRGKYQEGSGMQAHRANCFIRVDVCAND